MVQGSSSSAGKTLLVTALCRIYARRGLRVAPFKAQNMSNNSAVCLSGGEIGRAQALQASAAGIEPMVEMNPVLIKPEADAFSQVILNGSPWKRLSARDYYKHKDFLWGQVTRALDKLKDQYDLIVIEGAGSPAELNLLPGDIVNMAIARYIQSPVILIGDIDRGGIFAQLLGTLWLLEPEERALVCGLAVNKFRGDPGLFTEGVKILEEKGGIPVVGVIPYLKNLYLPEEDAVAIDVQPQIDENIVSELDIAVVRLPHISNFDDFDPLKMETGVRLRFVQSREMFGNPDAVILPGSKSTASDLDWLRQVGLAGAISEFANSGGCVVGLCGGYQMLGEKILDSGHLETANDISLGLGLLEGVTEFHPEKMTRQTTAVVEGGKNWLKDLHGLELHGYEIHQGDTQSKSGWLRIVERNKKRVSQIDGAVSSDGRIWGSYLHGIFGNDRFRRAWLKSLGWNNSEEINSRRLIEESINRLADSVESSLNMEMLDRIIWENDQDTPG